MTTPDFNQAQERILKALGIRTQVELAQILDIRQSSISDAKRRGSIPADWLVKLYRSHGLNPDWIVGGQEPMQVGPKAGMLAPVAVGSLPPLASQAAGRTVAINSLLTSYRTAEGELSLSPVREIVLPASMVDGALVFVADSTAGFVPGKGGMFGDIFGVGVSETADDRPLLRYGRTFLLMPPDEAPVLDCLERGTDGNVKLRNHCLAMDKESFRASLVGYVRWYIRDVQ